MSFFSYKPQIRQEGFQLPSPEPDTDFVNQRMDFTDDLVSQRSAYPLFSQIHQYPHHLIPTYESIPPQDHNHPSLPPSSFPAHFRNNTPSPLSSRSRSRSRPPSLPPHNSQSSGIGPTRTTRTRRTNSVSSTSPPRTHPRTAARPQAILIPSSHRPPSTNGTGIACPPHVSPLAMHAMNNGTAHPWYIPPQQSHSSEYSLPTPESLHSHSLSHSSFTPFGLSPTDTHLPPVSSLHSHSLSNHDDHISQPHSRSNSGTVPSVIPVNGIPAATVIPPTPASSVGVASAIDKQALLANEKRRRRRESHNAVERRRRDNINEKITELATLIPECMLDPTCGGLPASDDPLALLEPKKEDSAEADNGIVKANKGMILRKSVEYIRYLQQLVGVQATRNRELEQQLSAYRSTGQSVSSVIGSDLGSHNTHTHTHTHTHTPSSDGSGEQHKRDRDDLAGMILHEDVVGDTFGAFGLSAMGFGAGFVGGKGLFELESMPEGGEYMEIEDRQSVGGLSPSTGSAEGSEGREEEERGRRGRDGRPRGVRKMEDMEELGS